MIGFKFVWIYCCSWKYHVNLMTLWKHPILQVYFYYFSAILALAVSHLNNLILSKNSTKSSINSKTVFWSPQRSIPINYVKRMAPKPFLNIKGGKINTVGDIATKNYNLHHLMCLFLGYSSFNVDFGLCIISLRSRDTAN